MTDDVLDRLTDRAMATISREYQALRAAMVGRLGADVFDGEDDAELFDRYDPGTGTADVAIAVEGISYTLARGELIASRDRAGRVEWARVDGPDPDGWDWQPLPPPPSRARLN